MMKLEEIFCKNSVDSDYLPLTHIFDISHLVQFISSDYIPVDYIGECEVFKEKLLYFFYGKASFQLYEENSYPACFLFEFNPSPPIFGIYPFDSGAYAYNRTIKYLGESGYSSATNTEFIKNIRNFSLGSHATLPCFLNFFFGDQYNYLHGMPKARNNIFFGHYVENYHNMISDINANVDNFEFKRNLDERGSSVEIIYKEPFELHKLRLAIIPANTLFEGEVNSDAIENTMKNKYNCDVLKYAWTFSPQNNYDTIKELVQNYISNGI